MGFFGERRRRQPNPGYSVIDERLTIWGELDTEGTVRVDGRIEGSLHRAGTLIVGPRGTVKGNVEATDIVIGGNIHGDVHAAGRIEIEGGGMVHGEIRAKAMMLHDGAAVHGQVSIGAAPTAAATPPSQTPAPGPVPDLNPRRFGIQGAGKGSSRARG